MADTKFDDLTEITDLAAGDLFAVSRAGALGSRKITKASLIPALSESGVGGGWPFDAFAIICDQKAAAVSGGTFTNGAWRTRDLNTELIDDDGIVSLPGSNRFTLAAGRTYWVVVRAPAYNCGRNQVKLVRDPAGTPSDEATGISNYNLTTVGWARLYAKVLVTTAATFEIQHRCETTWATHGFGVECNFGLPERYMVIEISRYA